MTWDQIREWLEKNGWERRCVSECGTPQAITDAMEGRMWQMSIDGGTIVIHKLVRNIRVMLLGEQVGCRRLITTHPRNVLVERGCLRGLGLYSHNLLKEAPK
jgi:hypothetical protein